MISADRITDTLMDAGIPAGVIGVFDEEYELPEPDWITSDLGKAFRTFLFTTGLAYTVEQFDCNKFAKAASFHADICWAKTRKTEAALAFGIFAFASQGHAICIAVHKGEGDKLRVAFYEPQPAPRSLAEVPLTREDIESCIACLFI